MTKPGGTREARDNFVGLMTGKAPASQLGVQEAKDRLRDIDADLEVAPLVRAINRGDWSFAAIEFGALLLPELRRMFTRKNITLLLNLLSSGQSRYRR